MKPFILTEAEKEEILQKHINATSRQYLPESKHDTDEIYSFADPKKTPSTGYSDMDMKDFDEFDFELGFDAPSVVDMARLKKLDKKASKNLLQRRPKFTGSEIELDEEITEGYSVPQMIRDLKDSTEITTAHLDDIMNGDEKALKDAILMYGHSKEGKPRQGIIDKLEFLATASQPEKDYDEED